MTRTERVKQVGRLILLVMMTVVVMLLWGKLEGGEGRGGEMIAAAGMHSPGPIPDPCDPPNPPPHCADQKGGTSTPTPLLPARYRGLYEQKYAAREGGRKGGRR